MTCAHAAQAPRVFSPADVLGFEQPGRALVSPDGRQLLYAKTRRDPVSDNRVTTLELAPDLHTFSPLANSADCTRAAWSPDTTRLALVCKRDSGALLKVRDLRTGADLEIAKSTAAMSTPVWSADGTQIAVQQFVPTPDPQMGSVLTPVAGSHWATPYRVIDRTFFRLDGVGILPNGYMQTFVVPADGSAAPRQLTDGVWWSLDGTGPAWTQDGSEIYVTASRRADWDRAPQEVDIYAIRVADGRIRTVSDCPGIAGMPVDSPDGKWLAYLAAEERGLSQQNLRIRLQPRDGGAERVLLPDLDRSITSIAWTADSRALIATYEDHGEVLLVRIALSGRHEVLVRDVAGGPIELPFGGVYGGADFSLARNGTIAYVRSSASEPPQVAVLDSRGRMSVVTKLNEALMASVGGFLPAQRLTVRASTDDRSIDAWLILPRGAAAGRRAPIILDIHGGPFAAFGDRFSLKYQLFAAAGYAVLYANPRGSTGYGESFANSIHDAWPGHDADDLLDVVNAATARRDLDPNNVFATGTSGGGTMTILLAARGERIRAGVAVKPVVSWTSWIFNSDAGNFIYREWLGGRLPWTDVETYWARSPLALAPQVSAPLLLVAGDQDLRTPDSEAIQMYTALKVLGKEAVLMLGPSVTHESGHYRPSMFLQECSATLEWFDRHRTAATP